MNNFVKGRDLYGAPVSLNYKGDDTFKTCPGGMLSLLLLFLVGAYAFIKGKYMLDMEEWQLIQQEVMSAPSELEAPKHLNETLYSNISLGIQFQIKRERLTLAGKEAAQ